MPLLSIIIPVFNKESYLKLCVESVLNQTFRDFELILVNDGSTDSSGDLCDVLAKEDDRIKVIHQINKGVSQARNAGLEIAVGKFIGFVDGDDTLEPDMYTLLLGNAVKYEADVSICGVQKVFPDKSELFFGTNTLIHYNKEEAISALLKKEFLRSVYDKVYSAGIARGIKFERSINEDVFYNFQVLKAARHVVFDDQIKYNYIIRDNSVSMSKFSAKYMDSVYFAAEILKTCEKEFPAIVPHARMFDLIANLSALNMIMLTDRKKFPDEYHQVCQTLSKYSDFARKDKSVRRKHKYAMLLFKGSPLVYEKIMKFYCKAFNADIIKKS